MSLFTQVHHGDPWGYLFPVEHVSREQWYEAEQNVRTLPQIGSRLQEIMQHTRDEYNQRIFYVGFNARLFVEVVVAYLTEDSGLFGLNATLKGLQNKAAKNEMSNSGHVLRMPLIDSLTVLRMKSNKAAHGGSFQPEDQKHVITAMYDSVNRLLESIRTRVKLTQGKPITTDCIKVPDLVKELCENFEPPVALMLMTLRIPKCTIDLLMNEGYSLQNDFENVELNELLSIGLPKKVAEKIVGFKEQMSEEVTIVDFLDLLQSREQFFRTIGRVNEETVVNDEESSSMTLDVSANEFVPVEGSSGQSIERNILKNHECPQMHLNRINRIAWKTGESMIASAGDDGQLVIFNTETDAVLHKYTSDSSKFKDIDWHPSGVIAIAETGRSVSVCNPEKDKYFRFAPGGSIGPKNIFNAVKWSPFLDMGLRFVAGSSDRTVSIFDFNPTEKSKISQLGSPMKGHGHVVFSVDWSPLDKNQVASGAWDNVLCIWDIETRAPLIQKNAHDHYIEHLAYHPIQNILVTASADNNIKIWDTRTCENVAILKGHTNIVNCVAWSPDGSYLLSCGGDKTVRLWDVGIKTQVGVTCAHPNSVGSVSWKNNTVFASGGYDKIVKTWVVE